MSASKTPEQVLALTIIERVCSVLSLLGCTFIISTFTLSSAFRKPINRLVFYASIGNMLSNVGTMMSTTYVDSPNSFGCQAQSFLIQMFMPADVCWTLAMACNVYLTFFCRYDIRKLRKIEPVYFACCYGIPFIPALAFVFVRDGNGHRPYGNASLWCWISKDWNILRITAFYAPVWLVILVTFFIYIRAGRTIYIRRKQLLHFSSGDPDAGTHHGHDTTLHSITKPVGVFITTVNTLRTEPNSDTEQSGTSGTNGVTGQYSVNISADAPSISNVNSTTATNELRAMTNRQMQDDTVRVRTDNAAWSYTKCAILFFSAMLITWIPSSANRVHSLIHPGKSSLPLEYMSAFVLPLQGCWNCVIYIITSRAACRNFFHDLRFGSQQEVAGIIGRGRMVGGGGCAGRDHDMEQLNGGRRISRQPDTESMASLAGRRDNSSDREWAR